MVACRYGISLRAFNSIACGRGQRTREISSYRVVVSCRVEHSKINPISTTTMFYVVYDINTIALSCKEKSTLLMNEELDLKSERKVVTRVCSKAQVEKNALDQH